MQEGTHSSSLGGPQSTELGGGDPALGLFANPGLVCTLPMLEDPLPKPLKNTSLECPGRIL